MTTMRADMEVTTMSADMEATTVSADEGATTLSANAGAMTRTRSDADGTTTMGAGVLAGLSDDQLLGRTRELVRCDRRTLAQLVAHLGEIDARRLYARFAASSLFDYCVRELGFSEPQAFLRIRAARAVRRHPRLLGLIAKGELHLSGLKLIAPILEEDGAADLIERARGKTCREIEQLVADRRPRASVGERIRKLPTTTAPAAVQAQLVAQPPDQLATPGSGVAKQAGWVGATGADALAAMERLAEPTVAQACATRHRQRGSRAVERPEPLGAERYKVVFTADRQLVGLLEELRALYSHRDPNAELATIVGDAARMLRDALLKQRFGLGAKRRAKQTSDATRSGGARTGAARRRSASAVLTGRKDTSASREAGADTHAGNVDLTRSAALTGHKDTSASREAGADTRAARRGGTADPGASAALTGRKDTSASGRDVRVRSRHVPLEVRREVFRRDGGRCGYVDDAGVRCGERRWLELHHCDPWACGGGHSAENIALRCRAHNGEAARRAFGQLGGPSAPSSGP